VNRPALCAGRAWRMLRCLARMKGPVLGLCLAAGPVPAAAQEPPLARAALLQCLMTAADPGERVDGICADLADDICGVGRGMAAAAECRAELACRFVEEGQVLQARGAEAPDWRGIMESCRAASDAGACLRAGARVWWIGLRSAARVAGIDLDVMDAEVARCFLD